jgi:aryl-alcohol dehydrogenase-like predicted oxidoreductase
LHQGLSRAAIFHQVEASLERLNTDYIDVLQIHRYDKSVPPEETMKALHDLVQMNKVRYLGACSMWAHELAILQHTAEKYGWTKFVSMQNHYNLLYREEEREMTKFCNLTGIGMIPVSISSSVKRYFNLLIKFKWSPLASGRLARPPDQRAKTFRAINGSIYKDDNPTESEEIVRRVHKVAMSRNWPMSHVALAWLNQRVVSPIIGLSSVARIDEALDARGLMLSNEEEKYIEEPYRSQQIQGHV